MQPDIAIRQRGSPDAYRKPTKLGDDLPAFSDLDWECDSS
jgi:hypothetical protein